ncbi:hypothetical protein ACFQE5_14345 [Pseudonocardia hispaniensis]|uniref:Cation transport ATPase-like protein n=1 Tax=Pseudonocardia hispaniensis TaxID=904933 RepID=A0ABW1J3T5_9PSEU
MLWKRWGTKGPARTPVGNDMLALHSADVGLAKDAVAVVLLVKDLGVLANGVAEGRQIFASTIGYVLMGTSSNFGNVFSAAAVLPFLPSQILLNNLLHDMRQLTTPADRVGPEQLRAPSLWDLPMICRFMLVFGPMSPMFDFLTFGIMIGLFHTGPSLFCSGGSSRRCRPRPWCSSRSDSLGAVLRDQLAGHEPASQGPAAPDTSEGEPLHPGRARPADRFRRVR